MLPVQDDLGDVFHGVQKVVVSPLVPVNGHRAIFIHAARQAHGRLPPGKQARVSAALPPPGEPRAGAGPPRKPREGPLPQ